MIASVPHAMYRFAPPAVAGIFENDASALDSL